MLSPTRIGTKIRSLVRVRFREENKDAGVILSGGYCDFFEKHLKNSIFADPFIVLKGLNIILEYNAK